MKTVKNFLTVSALISVASAANAATWDITMSAQRYDTYQKATLILENFTGTWDDITGAGVWTGRLLYLQASSSTPSADLNITQTFSMQTTPTYVYEYGAVVPRQGQLSQFSIPACHDNLTGQNGNFSATCVGYANTPLFAGELFNTQGTAYDLPQQFIPSDDSSFTWTLQFYRNIGKTVAYIPLPLTVTLNAPGTPAVPVPAAAWLFGSGLAGLAGAVRRRRSI